VFQSTLRANAQSDSDPPKEENHNKLYTVIRERLRKPNTCE
jgi:hypothetical protein